MLVDDELSTGQTALNTIRGLLAAGTRCRRFVIAALVDVRSDPDAFGRTVAELGVTVEVVALARGRLVLPPDVLARGQALVAAHRGAPEPGSSAAEAKMATAWSTGVPRAGGTVSIRPGG